MTIRSQIYHPQKFEFLLNPLKTFDYPQKSIMMRFMRTTLNINDGLLEELRAQAQSERKPMTRVVEQTLRRGLSAGSGADPAYEPNIQTHEVGIKPAYQGMSMNQLYDQLETDTTLQVAEE
jgi:hypothetical protein